MGLLGIRAELHHGGASSPSDHAVGSLHVSPLWGVVDRAIAGKLLVGELAVVIVLEVHRVHGSGILDGREGCSMA